MTMKAAVLHSYGVAPRYEDFELPIKSDGGLLVKVTAASIVPLDLICASGSSYFGQPQLPYIPGVQGVGIASGSSETGRIWFQSTAGMKPGNGSMAEYCLVSNDAIHPIPDGVGDDVAAALGLSAVAAWNSLISAKVSTDDRVVVLGAGGVVGQVATQVARIMGARQVVAAARSPEGLKVASELGADSVIDVSRYDGESLTEQFAEICEGGPTVVIDPIFGTTASAAFRALSPYGRFVNLGSAASETAVFDSPTIRSRNLTIIGYTNNSLSAQAIKESLASVFELAAKGEITVAREVVPLSQVEEAWRRQSDGSAKRRLVLVS